MSTADPPRRIVCGLLLLALALRLGFVLASPSRELYWDEPFYQFAAMRFLLALHSLFGDGGGPTLREAFVSNLQRGEVYDATVALVYAVCGARPRAVFVLQALLDTLTCLLVYGLARAAGGARAGLVALALAALYEPFVFAAARLQAETLTALLYVGGLWALCVPERRRAAGSLGAGILIAAAMLTRPAVQWLFPLLLPAVVVRNSDRTWRQRALLALTFAAGFFLVVGPRLLVTRALTGRPVWSGTLKPGADMYGGAIPDNVGWKTDALAFAHPPRDELLAVVGDPPKHRLRAADYHAAAVRIWRARPAASAGVALHKLYQAWLHPYNDSRWRLLTGETGQAVVHRALLILALLGMPLSLRRWRVAIPLIVAALYLWLTCLVVKIEIRYAVLPMPLMICFAAVAIAVLSAGWQLAWRAGRRRRLVVLATATAAALVAAALASPGRLLEVLPRTPDAAYGVRVTLILTVIGWLTYVAAELAAHLWRRSTGLALLAPAAAFAALVVLVGRPLAQDWREWHATLAPHHGIVGQEFQLPAAIERPASAVLKLDALPGRAGAYDVVVRLNGEEIKRYRGGLSRSDGELPADASYQHIYVARGRTAEPEKTWYTIPIPADRLAPGGRLAVEVALEGTDERGSLAIAGDYPPDPSTYAGPSLFSPALAADTSLYKYLAEDDFRMRRSVQLAGSSHSRFFDGGAWSDQDLGVDPGRQLGRYRIFLLLVYERGIAIL